MDGKLDEILSKLNNTEVKLINELKAVKDICTRIQQDNQKLKETVTEQQRTIVHLQRLVNKRNLIVHGIDEVEPEDNLEHRILDMINTKVQVKCDKEDIEEIFRIGKRGKGNRPIKIGLISLKKKQEILNARRNLKGTKIYVNEDLPFEIREQQREKRMKSREELEEKSANKRLMPEQSSGEYEEDEITTRNQQGMKRMKEDAGKFIETPSSYRNNSSRTSKNEKNTQ